MKLTFKIYQKPDEDFELEAEASETIGDLKAKIQDSHGIDAKTQNIIFCGDGLGNDKTLESCKISEKSFLVLSTPKTDHDLPFPKQLEIEEYFNLDEDGLAKHLGTIPLSQLNTRTSTTPSIKVDPKSLPSLDFGFDFTPAPFPPVTTVSTFKYRPLSEILGNPPSFNSTSPPVPPATTVSTFKYTPMSTSLLDSESTSAHYPPVTTVSTFKYRPLSEILGRPSSSGTFSPVPPTTAASTSNYRPFASSLFESDSTSKHYPPVTTVSTFKYRPLSSILASSASGSASASQSTSKSVPMASSGGISASTSTHGLASASPASQSQNPFQGSMLGAQVTPRPGFGSSVNLSGGPSTPQTAQIRELLSQNPALRQQFIQQLSQEHPELGQMFTQNPDSLLQFLDSMGENGGPNPGMQAMRLNITEAERGAIERLEALGFPKQAVIEAYFACDKNEELAANYLLENA